MQAMVSLIYSLFNFQGELPCWLLHCFILANHLEKKVTMVKKNNKSISSVRIALKKNNATVSGAAYELRAGNYDSEVLTV